MGFWPSIFAILAAGIPSALAAYFGYKNSQQLRTKNGKTVGEMVSDVHDSPSIDTETNCRK